MDDKKIFVSPVFLPMRSWFEIVIRYLAFREFYYILLKNKEAIKYYLPLDVYDGQFIHYILGLLFIFIFLFAFFFIFLFCRLSVFVKFFKKLIFRPLCVHLGKAVPQLWQFSPLVFN